MKKQLSIRDLQTLSALLDGNVSPREKSYLEARLSKEAELREGFEGLRRTRILLRNSPKIRAPHNFTLTRQMAGMQEKQRSGLIYPFLKFSTVLASIFFIFALLGDFFVKQPLLMSPLQANEMASSAQLVEEYAAQQEMEGASPTMTPMASFMITTEAAMEKAFELSNAPMEPLPSTLPSMLMIEPTSTAQEAPQVAAAPEESDTQTREAATASSQEGELAVGSGITITDTETMADQAAQTDIFLTETPAETPFMGDAKRAEAGEPYKELNIWRVLEIIFGSLIVISGLSVIIYRAKHNQ